MSLDAEPRAPVDARLAKDRIAKIISLWIDAHPINSLPFTIDPNLIEIPFRIPIDERGKLVYCGRLDAIGRMRNGDWVIVDIKTTRRVTYRWIKRWHMDTQVSGYVYAAKQHLGRDVAGMLLGVIELPDAKVSSSKCKEHGVPYVECDLAHASFQWIGPIWRSDAQLESWRRTMIDLASKYEQLHSLKSIEDVDQVEMEGMFASIEYANACVSCEFNRFCEDGKPVQLAENYFRKEPWFCQTI